MLKKITAIMAAAVMTLSLAACGSSDDSESSGVYITKKKNTGKTTTAAEAAIPEAEDSDGSEAADSEAEPEPEMTLEEYLQSGVWVYTDETFAEIREEAEARKPDINDPMDEIFWNSFWTNVTFWDHRSVFIPSLPGYIWDSDTLYYCDRKDAYDPKKSYEITIETSGSGDEYSGEIENDRITLTLSDKQEPSSYALHTKNPITLVRKERIPMEQQLKDVVGTFKLVQDDSIFGSLDEESQKAYDYIRGSGTITIREDGTCLNQKGEETTVTFFDPDDHNFDLAYLGGLQINYLYRENEDILYATYNSANKFYYRLERVN